VVDCLVWTARGPANLRLVRAALPAMVREMAA